jgi:hypothetical protein
MIEILGWGSPIGLGLFFVGFGVFVYLASKANAISKWKKK